jgi:short-subunit dehydrogenase
MSSSHTLLTIGSGPGIASSVASLFATKGFNHIILLSRNATRLQADKAQILTSIPDSPPKIDTIEVDIANQVALKEALQRVESLGVTIECIHFNAARVEPSAFFDFRVEELEYDFKVRLYPIPSARRNMNAILT